MPRLNKLSPKQEAFVQEYLTDLNATQAAIRAGYSVRTAAVIGTENLSKPSIKVRIAEAMKAREQRTHITQDRVLQELARLAFSDLRRAFNEDGTLKLPNEWDDDTAAAMAGVDTSVTSIGTAEDPATLTTKKVKVFDKSTALTLAMRHLGMLNDKLEVTMPTVRVKDYTGRR
jgi:phage terminase small subunit